MEINMRKPASTVYSVEAVCRFLQRTLKPVDVAQLNGQDTTCVVCQEPFLGGDAPEFPIKLRCNHIIGAQCFFLWFAPWTASCHESCPYCRATILSSTWEDPDPEPCRNIWKVERHTNISRASLEGQAFSFAGSEPVHRFGVPPKLKAPLSSILFRVSDVVATIPAFDIRRNPEGIPVIADVRVRSQQYVKAECWEGAKDLLAKPSFYSGHLTLIKPSITVTLSAFELKRRMRQDSNFGWLDLLHDLVTKKLRNHDQSECISNNNQIPQVLPVRKRRLPNVPQEQDVSPRSKTINSPSQGHGHRAAKFPSFENLAWLHRHPLWKLCDILVRKIESLNVSSGVRKDFWTGIATKVMAMVPLSHLRNALADEDSDLMLIAELWPQHFTDLKYHVAGLDIMIDRQIPGWGSCTQSFMARIERRGRR